MDERGVILVVDDNADDIELIRRALGKIDNSIRLVAASSGLEAVGMFMGDGIFARRKTRPFLILLDLRLPQLSGLIMLPLLHADPHIKPIPVVIVTAAKDDFMEQESMNLGADGFVAKPMTVDKMRALIRRYRPVTVTHKAKSNSANAPLNS